MQRRESAKAFLELLEPIKDSLYGYAHRAVWRQDHVADVVQETCMTAWREFGRFERETNFRAWMFQILVNTIFRLNKQARRRREISLEDAGGELQTVLEREEAWSQLLESPDKLMDLLDDRLIRALGQLDPGERQCFLLRLLQGFAYKEIAAMLSIPLGTVMSRVHRARMKLRENLASLAVERGFIKEAM